MKIHDVVRLIVNKEKFPEGAIGTIVDISNGAFLVEFEEDWPDGFVFCSIDQIEKLNEGM